MSVNSAGSPSPWLVAAAGMLSLAVAMGVGRFAFTPLLPMMLHDGVISLSEGGWLATLNYIGYFAGALLSMLIRVEAARMVRIGLVATVVLTFGMGWMHTPWAWAILRTLAGAASAWVLVFAAGWCLRRLSELGRPELGGIMFCGPGVGIVLTGVAAGAMVQGGWLAASGWICFAVISIAMVALIWPQLGASPSATVASETASGPALSWPEWRLALVYGLAGFGYIITATFLPVIARHALPGSVWPDLFWPMFGAGIVCGAAMATRVSPSRDPLAVLMLAYAVQALAVLTAIVWPTVPGFAISSIFLGAPFTVITLFALHEARRLAGDSTRRLMGLMTATYGLGQIVGPPLATALVERTGSFSPSLLVAVGALVVGALIFLQMRRRR